MVITHRSPPNHPPPSSSSYNYVEHPIIEWIAEINPPTSRVVVRMGYDAWRKTSLFATPFDFDKAESIKPKGHCVAVRVTSEDPGDGFKPTSEKVQLSSYPKILIQGYEYEGYKPKSQEYQIRNTSGTKGGSSASPVIDRQVRGVALNAGGNSSSSSAFYLPLERVVRTLTFLQKSRDACKNKWEAVSIPRGTLQRHRYLLEDDNIIPLAPWSFILFSQIIATFCHKGFDETRRLGLQNKTEQLVRQASALGETGILVVHSVVPCGPVDGQLEPGDALVHVNGEASYAFNHVPPIPDSL
ncbi:unnamed protein product [Dovyalis caffra]|uniref:Serine protease n=1 Tax=Dovyalis caffra TaxID=77055 RepID=A0AAV1RRL5_9ROSI|nr:unnamed protein product [Dovyalis caffra]